MALDLTSFDAALKQHYTDDRIINMVYKDNPFLGLVSKMEDFGGRNLPIVNIWGNPQGRSVNFTRAQVRGQVTNSRLDDFLLTRVKDYSIATIDNETLEASKGNANAFMEAATTEIDGAINSLTRSIAVKMYRAGYGEVGNIATGGISSATITLAQAEDVTNFEVGMELDLSATLTGAVRAYGTSGNGLIITAIDRDAGTLTFGFNVTDATNGIPGATAGDFIFVRGDHSGSVLTSIAGLGAWVPDTAPTSTAFFGVDRSQDVTRLGGLRFDAASLPLEEALIKGAARSGREGAKLDHYFMSYDKFEQLEKALGAKVQYVDSFATAEVAFRGISINGPRGMIKCIPDQNCPNNRIYGLSLDMWKLYSLGKAVRVIDTDGLQMLRQASADGVEVRYGFYGNLGCRAPGHNIVLRV
jgi:hypothetical protein